VGGGLGGGRGGRGACRKPSSVGGSKTAVAIISLGPALPRASCDRPGSQTTRATSPPLFGLAPGGVWRAAPVTRDAGALLPHRFTLASSARERQIGGLLSVPLSVGSLPLG